MESFNYRFLRLSILLFIGLMFVSINSSCQEKQSTQDDIRLLRSFNENVLKKDTLDLDAFYKFVNINKSLKDNRDFIKTLSYMVWTFKENREKNPRTSGFDKFVPYSEMEDNYSKWAELKPFMKLEYKATDNVYYGINYNTTEKLGLFIVKKGKIISFFPYIHMGADPVRPFLLNKPADKKYIEVFNKYVGVE